MAAYGYARVSTTDQDLAIQEAALRAAGCQVIRAEKKSGTKRDGRTELQLLLDFLHPGDTLMVTRIDRLARSLKDLQDIIAVQEMGLPVTLLTPVSQPAGSLVRVATDMRHIQSYVGACQLPNSILVPGKTPITKPAGW